MLNSRGGPLRSVLLRSSLALAIPLALPFAGLGSGCVVKYGAQGEPAEMGAPVAAPVRLNAEVKEIKALMESSELIDQQDRLGAALLLAEQLSADGVRCPPEVKAYLRALIDIETRGQPSSVPLPETAGGAARFGEGKIDEVELNVDDPPPAVEATPEAQVFDPDAPAAPAAPAIDAAALLSASKARAAEGDNVGAMRTLERCKGAPCWAEVEPAWTELRDAEVFRLKEQSARRFLELRGESDPALHREGLLSIAADLSALRARYPGSIHAADIARHLERVQRELETLPEQ